MTQAPRTTVPSVAAPDAAASDTAAPDTAAPDTAAPDTVAPGSGAPGTDGSGADASACPGPVRRVLLAVHTGRADIVELARRSAARLARGGIVVRLLDDEAAELDIPDAEVVHFGPDAAEGTELVIVFGGDGTFLRAAELARPSNAALTGVNLGRVGFLAETEPEGVEETLTAIERCAYSVEERLTLEVTVRDAQGRAVGSTWALNEASVEKAERQRVLDVVLAIDGRPLTSFGCDGVLCATPTGSTAYAFSSGGPVVWPDVEALLVVPSNAHALFARPLVASPESVITVAIPVDGNHARVSADGRRVLDIPSGGRVDVRRSARPVRIARVHPTTFGDRLVAKFGLPVRGFREARSTSLGQEVPPAERNVLLRDELPDLPAAAAPAPGDPVTGGAAAPSPTAPADPSAPGRATAPREDPDGRP